MEMILMKDLINYKISYVCRKIEIIYFIYMNICFLINKNYIFTTFTTIKFKFNIWKSDYQNFREQIPILYIKIDFILNKKINLYYYYILIQYLMQIR